MQVRTCTIGEAKIGLVWTAGSPMAAIRGGTWSSGTDGGVFAVNLNHSPSDWNPSYGARCCWQ